MDLNSFELEKEAPCVFDMENLTLLETADKKEDAFYPDKMGNLIHLHTLEGCHIGSCSPLAISKCYKYGNKALITNYQSDMHISPDIEYLNIFIGWIDDGINGDKDISNDHRIILLNNLHNGLKYLQINIVDYGLLKYIKNLPITLENFNVVITNCMKIVFYSSLEEYEDEAKEILEQIKTPFECKKKLYITKFK